MSALTAQIKENLQSKLGSYPVAEVFESPQGEGQHCGVLMTFLRFAGCTVGRPYSTKERERLHLQVYQERCTLWNGRQEFSCDTNFRMANRMTIEQLLTACLPAERVCLTGGEPLMHNLLPLVSELFRMRKRVHIETSGTYPIERYVNLAQTLNGHLWCALSPKKNFLKHELYLYDEIKILVGKGFSEDEFLREFEDQLQLGKIWLQPINELKQIDDANMMKCLALQKKYKKARISSQAQKVWNVR